MEVLFIGTGDAFGAAGRRQAGILVRGPGGVVLLDCGTTTLQGLAALGVGRNRIDAVLVTHFHADHFGGIPLFLLAALHEDRRRRPLTIAGPPGIERRVLGAAAALGHPLEARAWPFGLRFQEIACGADLRVGRFEVGCFEARHQPDSCPRGLRLAAGSRRIVYTGDTGWFDALPERARGADLFICECTLAEPGFQYHLSLNDLLSRRERFDCGRMVLTHLGEAMAGRRGRCDIETADDGMTIRL
ncbi:MAG: MBL fold metallo-hydrolase [Acidobacteriota bacterium]